MLTILSLMSILARRKAIISIPIFRSSCLVLSFRSSRCDGSAEPKGNPFHTNSFYTTFIETIKKGIPVSVSFISCRIEWYICRVWCGCTTNREHGPNGRGMLLERRPVLHVLGRRLPAGTHQRMVSLWSWIIHRGKCKQICKKVFLVVEWIPSSSLPYQACVAFSV